MLAVLDALQILIYREAGVTEARRVSYRNLDIEQIGHVYEGLLDHGCVRANEIMVGLTGRGGEDPEVALSELEAHQQRGEAHFIEYLHELTGRTERQLKAALQPALDAYQQSNLRAACDNDDRVYPRVLPFVGLLRPDLRELPTVFLAGDLYTTKTSDRRDSGTQYTTKELADEIVLYALEPLVYSPGPAEGAERSAWKLKSSAELLKLKVCDPAVGSGAILVAACRYLAERLMEAWDAELAEGKTPAGLPPTAGEETRELLARRVVTDHCLYGVDRSPMAAEMAKLSLWLTTMSKERPFTFLNYSIRTGDSLLGITSLDQLEWFHINPERGKLLLRQGHQRAMWDAAEVIKPRVAKALEYAALLSDITVLSNRDSEDKAWLSQSIDEQFSDLSVLADTVIGAALSTAGKGEGELDRLMSTLSAEAFNAFNESLAVDQQVEALHELGETAERLLEIDRPVTAPKRACLHWPLVFPEVFLDQSRPVGFDAIIGNPPFMHGQRLTSRLGTAYRNLLVDHVATRQTGSADLVAYFFLRASVVGNALGLFATNTIAEGDTRQVGLDQIVNQNHWRIYRANKSLPWPGKAALEVSQVWASRRPIVEIALDGRPVVGITPYLEPVSRASGPGFPLYENRDTCYQGVILLGMGFAVEPDDARRLINADPRNKEVLRPYLNGEDLTEQPDLSATRWAIDFADLSLEAAQSYPDCFQIVLQKVKPERDLVKRAARREKWWQYAEKARGLYSSIRGKERVIVVGATSKYALPAFVDSNQIFANALYVFSYDDYFHFAVLSSALHWWWILSKGSTLERRIRYTPSDGFETFPQPPHSALVERLGAAVEENRREMMRANNEGLTKTYNRVHNLGEHSTGIEELRRLHRELDIAVAEAYGWGDLDLDHGFHETSQGVRYTIGPAARTEVLDRLLELNHQRYADEVAQGLHSARQEGS
jgi:hypothetical protein